VFEYHGWINIVPDDSDDADIAVLDERSIVMLSEVEEEINRIALNNGIINIYRNLNGENHLIITGFNNHRRTEIIDLFYWIAKKQPFSYGLLHIRDDEDGKRGYENTFRVFAIRKGKVIEETEKLLSPCIPVIEDLFE